MLLVGAVRFFETHCSVSQKAGRTGYDSQRHPLTTCHNSPNMYRNRTLDVPTVYRCTAYVRCCIGNCHVPNATSFVYRNWHVPKSSALCPKSAMYRYGPYPDMPLWRRSLRRQVLTHHHHHHFICSRTIQQTSTNDGRNEQDNKA